MKKITLLSIVFFCCLQLTKAQPGKLDPSFGTGGIVTAGFGQGSTFFKSTVVQKDGKLIAAGYTSNGTDYDFVVARYHPDGTPDDSFGDHGKQITNFDAGDDYAYSVTIQKDGKIVLAGSSGGEFGLARYNLDGSLDRTFSDDGKQITDFGFLGSYATSVAMQKDGKIVAAGTTLRQFTPIGSLIFYANYFALARYNNDGSPDKGFAGVGKLTTAFDLSSYGNEFYDVARALVIQKNGKILAVGESVNSSPGGELSHIALARYNTDGNMDNTFSGDGMVLSNYVGSTAGKDVVIQSNGKILVAGLSSHSILLTRFNVNGSLDNKFSNNGFSETYFNIHFLPLVSTVALQKDSKIIVGGSTYSSASTLRHFALWRFSKNGIPDNSFGDNGTQITSVTDNTDKIEDIAIADGKLYAVGFGQFSENLGVVARYFLDKHNKIPSKISVKTLSASRPSSAKSKADINGVVSLKLAPNPVNNIVNIYTTGLQKDEQTTLSIITASGVIMKTIQTKSSTQVIQLNVSSLASGVYTVKILSDHNVKYTQFVKL